MLLYSAYTAIRTSHLLPRQPLDVCSKSAYTEIRKIFCFSLRINKKWLYLPCSNSATFIIKTNIMEVKDLIEEREIARVKVTEYFYKNIRSTCPYLPEDFITKNADHIINIGTSIYCTKRGIGPAGGSFVTAVVNNDLSGAFGRADDVNELVLKFYVVLIANL